MKKVFFKKITSIEGVKLQKIVGGCNLKIGEEEEKKIVKLSLHALLLSLSQSLWHVRKTYQNDKRDPTWGILNDHHPVEVSMWNIVQFWGGHQRVSVITLTNTCNFP